MSSSRSSIFTEASFHIPTKPGRKYQKCSTDSTLFNRTDLDDSIHSIHSLEPSNYSQLGNVSISTSKSICNEIDKDSVCQLNSQLLSNYAKESRKHLNLSSYHHKPTYINNDDYSNYQLQNFQSNPKIKRKNSQAFNSTEKNQRNERNNLDKFLRRDDNRLQYELSKEQTLQHNQFLRYAFDKSEGDDEDYDADDEDLDIDRRYSMDSKLQSSSSCYADALQREIDEMEYLETLELEQQFQGLNL